MPEFATSPITRRFMLGGLGSLLSTTVLAKPETPHAGHGHSDPPLPSPGLSVRLDFADGKSLVFAQSQATDIGDYVGPFVRQKCLRRIASGNGDYRDAFLVDFRPDADGKHQEVVIEFGTLFKFLPTGAVVSASGVAPLHIGLPPVPLISKLTGGLSTQAGTLTVSLTYVTPQGETPASKQAIALKAGERAVVKSPPPGMGATHYNVYASLFGVTPGNAHLLQNATPIPLGTDWTEPGAGMALTRKALPMVRPTTVAYRATISGGRFRPRSQCRCRRTTGAPAIGGSRPRGRSGRNSPSWCRRKPSCR